MDALRTFVEHIAIQVLDAIHLAGAGGLPVYFTGGGAHNSFLMERFREKGIHTATFDAPGWVDFKEAIIFAFLGLQVLLGRTNTLASVTGSKIDALCGSIHLPATGGFPIFKTE